MQRVLLVLTLAFTLVACGASPQAVETAVAQTQQAADATAAALGQTEPAGAPTNTPVPTDTKEPTATATTPPTDTATATDVPTDTPTPKPSNTPEPTDTATPAVTNTKAPPAAPAVPPTNTPQPGPDFVTTIKDVRQQIDTIGYQIDQAVRYYENGFIDCPTVLVSYNYVVARRDLNPPGSPPDAYTLYQSGVDLFQDKLFGLYGGCSQQPEARLRRKTLSDVQLSTWRDGAYNSRDLLTQAIIAAGGTP